MLCRCILALGLISVGCSTATSVEDRMATVVETFQSQLDRSTAELQAIEAEIEQAQLSEEDRVTLASMATEVHAHIMEVEFDLMLAQFSLNVDRMEDVGSELVSIFSDVSDLRLQFIRATIE
jgi:DNA-binding transcriptional regulator YbjK